MIRKLIKWLFYLVLTLIVFAILPKGILEKLKQFFNWDIFLKTLKTGLNNLLNFLKETIGIDFSRILLKLKDTLGIDLIAFWTVVKNFLSNIFQRLANFFK